MIIGYISPDYFTHSVSYFIEAPLVHHDYTSYRIVVYSAVVKVGATLCLLHYGVNLGYEWSSFSLVGIIYE